ncbi:MAG: alpha/beta hydrolase [Lactobacillus sp.]|nr:alpha/beta hydrolase [Lactobacillus sp.]
MFKSVKARFLFLGLCLVLLSVLGACSNQSNSDKASSSQKTTKVKKNVPKIEKVGPKVTAVIYLHGYGGSADGMSYLVQQARLHDNNTSDIVATVQDNGDFKLSQAPDPNVQYPLIRVTFSSNKLMPETTAKIMTRFLKKLKSQYGVQQIDAVGHSAGSVAWIDYAFTAANTKDQPQLNKLAVMANHVNGYIGQPKVKGVKPHTNSLSPVGQPKIELPQYRQLLKRQNHFPKTTAVLNIYGDLEDGSDSDGSVTNDSSRSLQYLLGSRPASYTELEIKKNQAGHSQLRENPKVAQAINDFIFKK